MILADANMCSQKYDNIWILPLVSDNPKENYILIYGMEGNYTLKYKDLEEFKFTTPPNVSPNPEFSEKFDEICKKYNLKILMDWTDFSANYGLEDISKCRQNITIKPHNEEIEYELEEIIETVDRYVYDKESGENVYEIYPYSGDEDYLKEIKGRFNIIDSETLWGIRHTIHLKEF